MKKKTFLKIFLVIDYIFKKKLHLFYQKLSYSENKNVSNLIVAVENGYLTLVVSYRLVLDTS